MLVSLHAAVVRSGACALHPEEAGRVCAIPGGVLLPERSRQSSLHGGLATLPRHGWHAAHAVAPQRPLLTQLSSPSPCRCLLTNSRVPLARSRLSCWLQ